MQQLANKHASIVLHIANSDVKQKAVAPFLSYKVASTGSATSQLKGVSMNYISKSMHGKDIQGSPLEVAVVSSLQSFQKSIRVISQLREPR